MAALEEFLNNFKERIKTAIQEQQESELYISLKERYEGLPSSSQLLVKISTGILLALFVLWYPVSSFVDTVDLNSTFEDRRQGLKDLLKIERDYSTISTVRTPPSPFSMKAQMDQRILAFGVKPEQIKDSVETNNTLKMVDERGIQYHINHLTLRQAVDVAYELEQVDQSFKIADLELTAEQGDPHFYEAKIKIINYAPKAQVTASNAK